MRFHPQSRRASVVLVALCCVTVLGFGLASYLSISSQAMKLANRSHAANVSGQLAETGLEEALRSINKNDWSGWSNGGASAIWQDVDATTKQGTLTFPAGKFGAGITGTVNVRVHNYNSAQLDSAPWSNLTTYQLNDLVSDNGVWYRSVRDGNLGKATNKLGWWVPAPIPWAWSRDISYSKGDLVNHKGIWFRCVSSFPTTAMPQVSSGPVAPYPPVPAVPLDWTYNTDYVLHDVVDISGSWYTCTTPHHSSSSFSTDLSSSYWSSIPKDWKPILDSQPWTNISYSERDVVSYKGKLYRCIVSSTSSDPDNPTDWTSDLTAISLSWSSASEYSKGALVFNNGNWYTCTTNHESSDPDLLGSGMWTALVSTTDIAWKWKASATFNFNDVVYLGTPAMWYRCKVSTSSGATPTASGSDWENALSGGAHGWNSGGINYNLGDTVYYDITSQWYRCTQAHTSSGSVTPASTVYWSNLPLHSNRWDPDKTYNINDTVSYNGIWYLCLSSNSHHFPPTILPFYDSYWAGTTDTTRQWNATTVYTAGSYCSYGGAWYKCTTGPSAHQPPNDSAFWTSSWVNSSGLIEGAPIILAEGTGTLTEGVPIKTILRATIAPTTLFPNAAAATTTLTINGGAGTVDSYDSNLGPISSQNSFPTNTGNYSAILAAGSTSSLALTIGNGTEVRGYLSWPSPPAGIGTSVTVKGLTSPGSPNVDPAKVSRSPYIPQFDPIPRPSLIAAFGNNDFPKGLKIPTPTSSNATLDLGTAGGTTPSRYYYDDNLRLQSGSFSYYSAININGPVILYVNGYLRMQNGGIIDIKSTGSLEIHYVSYFRAYSGSHGILNRTKDPKKLVLIGDSSAANASYLQNGNTGSLLNKDFYGIIYAPNTTASLGFDVQTGVNFYGAISAREITFSSEANLHYDTSLRYIPISGVDAPYSITDWRELTDPAEKVNLTP